MNPLYLFLYRYRVTGIAGLFLLFLFVFPGMGKAQTVPQPKILVNQNSTDTICLKDPVNYLINLVKPDSSIYALSYSTNGSTYSNTVLHLDSTVAGTTPVFIRQYLKSDLTKNNFSTFNVAILPHSPKVPGVIPRPGHPGDSLNRTIFICQSYNANLNDSVIATSPYNFRWYATDTSGNKVPFNGQITNAKYTGRDSIFYVQNVSSTSCPGRFDTIHVSVLPKPTLKNSPSEYQVCQTKPVTFTALDVHTGNSPTYDWYRNDTLVVQKGGPSYTISPNPFTPKDSVKVWYVVHISKDAPYYHCDSVGPPFSSDTISIKILPLAKVPGPIIGPDVVYQGQKGAFYQVPLDTSLVYSWRYSNPAHGTIRFANNTVIVNYADSLFNPLNPGPELIDTLIVTVRNVCDSIQETLLVHIRPRLKPINILTPNGDGINDVWTVYFIDYPAYTNNSVMIYDRYGNMVYKKTNYSMATLWDGTYNGKPLSEGTYYYVFFYNEDNVVKEIKGYITILRR